MKISKDRAIFHHLFGFGYTVRSEENDSVLCLFGDTEKEVPVGELTLCATDANGQAILERDVVFYPSVCYIESATGIPQVREGQVVEIKNWFCKIFIKDNKTGIVTSCWPQSCVLKGSREA